MEYIERIDEIINRVNKNIIDLSVERKKATAPTQVSSEFLTNKEQGDWAEQTFIHGINDYSQNYIAVKYGRDDDIIAGEPDFAEFYENYQRELDTIGKRPDVLIFERKDFPYDTCNISRFDNDVLDALVPKAKCGIEVRSSSFMLDRYNQFMETKFLAETENIIKIKDNILSCFSELLRERNNDLFEIISQIDKDNVHTISFRTPSWVSSEGFTDLSLLLKEMKQNLISLRKRVFLSITPKTEDLKVVYTWIKRYKVPHYYVQIFFDKAYGISYENILELACDESLKGKKYYIEKDIKNQNKTTIKVNVNNGENIFSNVTLPNHASKMKELGRGRMLFYVTFEKSDVTVNQEGFKELFGFDL